MQESEEAWRQLTAIVTLVARHDPRPLVADTAAQSLLAMVQAHAQRWTPAVWNCVFDKGIAYLLDIPPPYAETDAPVVTPFAPTY